MEQIGGINMGNIISHRFGNIWNRTRKLQRFESTLLTETIELIDCDAMLFGDYLYGSTFNGTIAKFDVFGQLQDEYIHSSNYIVGSPSVEYNDVLYGQLIKLESTNAGVYKINKDLTGYTEYITALPSHYYFGLPYRTRGIVYNDNIYFVLSASAVPNAADKDVLLQKYNATTNVIEYGVVFTHWRASDYIGKGFGLDYRNGNIYVYFYTRYDVLGAITLPLWVVRCGLDLSVVEVAKVIIDNNSTSNWLPMIFNGAERFYFYSTDTTDHFNVIRFDDSDNIDLIGENISLEGAVGYLVPQLFLFNNTIYAYCIMEKQLEYYDQYISCTSININTLAKISTRTVYEALYTKDQMGLLFSYVYQNNKYFAILYEDYLATEYHYYIIKDQNWHLIQYMAHNVDDVWKKVNT
jgi:hypothetical protein